MSRSKGFTLVELIVVITVIAILATITIVSYGNAQTRAAQTVLQSDLTEASDQLNIDKAQSTNGQYPNPLSAANNGNGVPASPGTAYVYKTNGTAFCLTASSTKAGTPYYYDSTLRIIQQGACSATWPS